MACIVYLIFLSLAVIYLCYRKKHTIAIFLIIVSGLTLRAYIAVHDPRTLHDLIGDDYHYYFKIARNIALGNGTRCDASGITTGFQPLFVLATVPIFKLVADRVLALNFVMLLNVAISPIYLLFLYKIVRLFASKEVGVFAIFLWAVSFTFISVDLNGVETNTALCMLCISSYYYLKYFVMARQVRIRNCFILGSIIGVGALVRMDLLLIIPAISIDLALRNFRIMNPYSIVKRIAITWITCLIIVAPWLARNFMLEGSIMPVSGEAIRFLSLSLGYFIFGRPTQYFPIDNPPISFFARLIGPALLSVKEQINNIYSIPAFVAVITTCVIISVKPIIEKLKNILFLLIFYSLLAIAYIFFIPGQLHYPRYFFVVTLGHVILFSLSLDILIGLYILPVRNKTRRILYYSLGFMILLSSLNISMERVRNIINKNQPSSYLIMAKWLERNTPKESVIAGCQSGIIGYYLDRKVFNLDGICSRPALNALKAKTIDKYIMENKIEYIADWNILLERMVNGRSSSPGFLDRQKIIINGDNSDPFGWDVYQIVSD